MEEDFKKQEVRSFFDEKTYKWILCLYIQSQEELKNFNGVKRSAKNLIHKRKIP